MNLVELARRRQAASTPAARHNVPVLPQAVYPPGTGQRAVDRHTSDYEEVTVEDLLQNIALDLRRLARQNFDSSNPVDECVTSALPVLSPVTIMRDYDIPERIESITVLLPVGITSATLQLGTRFLPLYSGVATTLITPVNFTGLGIIISPDDVRQLTFVGTATSGLAVCLAGHCLERSQER